MEKAVKKVVKKPAKKPIKKKVVEKKVKTPKLTNDMFNNICNLLSFSDISLVNACKVVGIDPHTFYVAMNGNEEKLQQYVRARELQADFIADQIIDISNDKIGDTMIIYKDGAPIEVEDKEYVSRSKLKIDARKWIASKLKPKKYGDKLEVEQKLSVTQEVPLFPDITKE